MPSDRRELSASLRIDLMRVTRSLRDLKAYQELTDGMTLPQIAATEHIELRYTDLPGDMLSDAGTLDPSGDWCICLDHSLSDSDQRKYFMDEMLTIISRRSQSYIVNGEKKV